VLKLRLQFPEVEIALHANAHKVDEKEEIAMQMGRNAGSRGWMLRLRDEFVAMARWNTWASAVRFELNRPRIYERSTAPFGISANKGQETLQLRLKE
jgi:hypothetical protein